MDSSIWFLGEEVVVTDSSRLSNHEDVHENEKCKPKNKKEKRKMKVHKKEKREKGKNGEKTKSQGFRRRFLSFSVVVLKVKKEMIIMAKWNSHQLKRTLAMLKKITRKARL